MEQRRKVCFITSTRAEYGLLQNIMQITQDSSLVDSQVIVTGTHLSKDFGCTVNQIEKDGIHISKKIEMLLAGDNAVSTSKSMGMAQISFAEAIEELKPDLIVLLGDRYEILSAASAALIAGVPVAHIHGGEITEGAIDDSIRHAITKMAHLHFASTAEYKNRIIQMGENPEHVFHVGAPGLDHLNSLQLLDIKELSQSLNYSLDRPFAVVTYHPVTLPTGSNIAALNAMLSALDEFPEMQFLITYPNADTFGRQLIERLKEYCHDKDNIFLTMSLGQLRYLSAIKNCAFVIGNSSSGIIEVPSLNKPTVNIGDRQKGRVAAQSVVHCNEDKDSIVNAINYVLSDDMQKMVQQIENPYKKGHASKEIFDIIMNNDLKNFMRKPFHDIDLEIKKP